MLHGLEEGVPSTMEGVQQMVEVLQEGALWFPGGSKEMRVCSCVCHVYVHVFVMCMYMCMCMCLSCVCALLSSGYPPSVQEAGEED